MKYFTIDEMCKTSTKLDNVPNAVERANLVCLIENVLDPIRERYGKPIIVTSGFRSERVNKAVGGVSTSQHCLDVQTEILTTEGWRNIDTIKETDSVISVDYTDNELKISPIKRIVKKQYNGDLYCYNSNVVNYAVTDKHRMFVKIPITRKDTEYKFVTAESVFKKRRKFQVAFTSKFESEINLDFIKLCIACIADGCVHKKRNSYDILFSLKKERKIKELTSLLKQQGVKYSIKYCKSREKQGQYGVYSIRINSQTSREIISIIGNEKKLPFDIIYNNSNTLKQLLRYYAFYDGCYDKRDNCTGITISTTSEWNKDILSIMAIFSGYSCVVKETPPTKHSGNIVAKKTLYTISLADRIEYKSREEGYSKRQYNGLVWCVESNNQTIITRRNNRIVLLGNCLGQASDIITKGNTDNALLFNLILDMKKKGKIVFDQLIAEFPTNNNPSWLHISYKAVGTNRGQVLVASKVNGKTKYSNYK